MASNTLRFLSGVLWTVLFAALGRDASGQGGTVTSQQKISATQGGFNEPLSSLDQFGWGVAYLGDLDGNGIPSIAVGEPGNDDGCQGCGAVWILEITANGFVSSNPKVKIAISQGGWGVTDAIGGWDIDSMGDFNLDGVGDLVVGAGNGVAWILLLNQDGTVADFHKIDDAALGGGVLDIGNAFGHSVSFLGDVDGDGVGDLAIGDPRDDDTTTADVDTGAVWIVFMNSDGTVKSSSKISETQGNLGVDLTTLDQFGTAVTGLGDLDMDGVPDLAVGHPGGTDSVWILFLTPAGTVGTRKHEIHAPIGASDFGYGLGSIGDMNRDGIPDLAVGATGQNSTGAIHNIFLNRNGTVLNDVVIATGTGGFSGEIPDSASFGRGVCIAGDLNGDGNDDMVVGSRNDGDGLTPPEGSAGAAWVLFLDSAEPATVWTGESSTDWHQASNWSNGVPNATKHAIIPNLPTGGVFPTASLPIRTLDLTIQSDATVTVTSGATSRVYGNLRLDGSFALSGALEVDGSMTGDDTTADFSAGGTGACLTVGRDVRYQGGFVSVCSFELSNPTTETVVFDVPGGYPGDLIINTLGQVVIASPTLTVGGTLIVQAGTLGPGLATVTVSAGAVVVESAGRLTAFSDSLAFTGSSVLTIRGVLAAGDGGTLGFATNAIDLENGGTLELLGKPGTPASVLGDSGGSYALTAKSGSNLVAHYFRFENMELAGVSILSGAQFGPPPTDLRDGTFARTGPNADTDRYLLSVERLIADGPLELFGLTFLHSNPLATTFNIQQLGTESISLVEWGGNIGGDGFDNNSPLVNWGSQIDSIGFEEGTNSNTLRWRTLSESDVIDFRIERAPRPGAFTTIHTVAAIGLPTIPQNYAFKDTTILPGVGYRYRLIERLGIGVENVLASYVTDGLPGLPDAGGFQPLTAVPGAQTGPGHAAGGPPVVKVQLTPGVSPSFSWDGRERSLRLQGADDRTTIIDASSEPLVLSEVQRQSTVEVSGLRIDAGTPDGVALVVEDSTGVVLLQDIEVHGRVLVTGATQLILEDARLSSLELLDSGATAMRCWMERVSLSSSSGARGWDTDWGLPKVEVGSFLESSPLPALRLELRASNPRELQVDGPPGLAWRLEGGFSLNQLVLGQQAQFKGPVRFLDLTGRDRWQAELPPWMAFSDLYLRVRALSPSRSAPWSNMATWSPR